MCLLWSSQLLQVLFTLAKKVLRDYRLIWYSSSRTKITQIVERFHVCRERKTVCFLSRNGEKWSDNSSLFTCERLIPTPPRLPDWRLSCLPLTLILGKQILRQCHPMQWFSIKKKWFKCFKKLLCNQKILNWEKPNQNRTPPANNFGQRHGNSMNPDKEHSTG